MWYYEKDDGVMVQIKVIPGARQPGIVGVQGDFLKIKISARPEKGRANEALIDFLAEKFRVPLSRIHIVRGHMQSLKLVFVPVHSEILKNIVK